MGRMHVILSCEPLEEVDCFKHYGTYYSHPPQLMEDVKGVWYTE